MCDHTNHPFVPTEPTVMADKNPETQQDGEFSRFFFCSVINSDLFYLDHGNGEFSRARPFSMGMIDVRVNDR